MIMNIKFPMILDGAMGTQLQKRGLKPGMCPERWSCEHPDAVLEVQRAYVEAGSDVIYSPTFGANALRLESHGEFNKVEELNRKLVGLSKTAAGGNALVAGDISSSGGMLYPLGDMSFEDFFQIYCEQAKALEDAGVDLFAIETMTNIPEARAAVLAVKSVSSKPIFVTFSCDENGKTMMGTDICAALQILQGMGIDAFGMNCSVGPEEAIAQMKRLYKYSCVPLIAKPNAGLPETVDGETVYTVGPEEFAAFIPALAEAGANIFGACCGSHEKTIQAIKNTLKGIDMKEPNPEDSEMLPCATEKELFMLEPSVSCEIVLPCDDELEDAICDLDEGELFGIEIKSSEDVAIFADCQYAIKNPLCLLCDDAVLLEKALRAYQGRALYEGELPDDELMPLVEKYGLII